MSEKTLTRMDLSEAVFREVGLSRNESANLVEAVLQHWRSRPSALFRSGPRPPGSAATQRRARKFRSLPAGSWPSAHRTWWRTAWRPGKSA